MFAHVNARGGVTSTTGVRCTALKRLSPPNLLVIDMAFRACDRVEFFRKQQFSKVANCYSDQDEKDLQSSSKFENVLDAHDILQGETSFRAKTSRSSKFYML